MISPIENSGMVLRTQDYSIIRHNEENHSVNQHMQLQDSLEESVDVHIHTVQKKDDSDGANTHHDAKDEGRNKYYNNRNVKKKNALDSKGVVVPKGMGGFDMSV